MKKLLLLLIGFFCFQNTFSQPVEMLNETFRLKSLSIGNGYLTPNGENPNVTIYEVAGDYVLDADGIFNTLNAAVSFSGNSIIFNVLGVTLQDCAPINFYYEDVKFHHFVTSLNLDSKTFTYCYTERNSFNLLRLRDANKNWAHYSTERVLVANPLFFQPW